MIFIVPINYTASETIRTIKQFRLARFDETTKSWTSTGTEDDDLETLVTKGAIQVVADDYGTQKTVRAYTAADRAADDKEFRHDQNPY